MLDQLLLSNLFDNFVDKCSVEAINNFTAPTGHSLLEISAIENKVNFFDYMIKKVFNLEQHNLSNAMGEIKQILEKRKAFLQTEYKAGYNRLHIAVIDGEDGVVRYILSHNLIFINDCDVPIGTPLHLAILLGRIDCIEALAEYSINVDLVNKHNQTPLQMAIEHKIIAQVQFLIPHSQNIDQARYMGLTTLQMAIIYNCRFLFPLLMDVGASADVEIQKFHNISIKEIVGKCFDGVPLLPISDDENGFLLSVKLYGELDKELVKHLSKEVINRCDGNGNTLLHLAASLQNLDLCSLLIERGANVNFLNYFGKNPFHEMIRVRIELKNSTKKPVAIGTCLIKAGIEFVIADFDDNIFKDTLVLNNEKFMILVLENVKYIDYNALDFTTVIMRRWFQAGNKLLSVMPSSVVNSVLTPDIIDFYTKHAKPNEILEMLSNNFITPEILSKCPEHVLNQVTPLILDKLSNRDEVNLFKSFLELKISKPGLLTNGETLLTNLIKSGKADFVHALLESNSRELYINAKNKSGESPLHLSIITSNVALIDIFAVEHQDYCCIDSTGSTVFTTLFRQFSNKTDLIFIEKTAKIMITNGASPFDTDSNNKTALDYCCDDGLKSRILSFAQKRNVGPSSGKNETECKICLNRPIEFVLECGHVYCSVCIDRCKICPTCRKPFKSSTKIYF